MTTVLRDPQLMGTPSSAAAVPTASSRVYSFGGSVTTATGASGGMLATTRLTTTRPMPIATAPNTGTQ
jgi:hypothetical protein